jgi:chemotaxis protein CheD
MTAQMPPGRLDGATGLVHRLHPGDVMCAERGDRLDTLLGSCVAVVLTDPARTVGAMCHIVHSQPARSAGARPTASADAAIDALYRLLLVRALSPRLALAFVYGGGNMFPTLLNQRHVGEENGRYVLHRLASDGVRILLQDLGGTAYRRLSWTVGPEPPVVEAVEV